ncbi:MAG: restriction endonuclease, partial [Nitrososphaerales archaeon]
PLKLDYRFLNRFPEFVEFWNPGKHKMQGAPRDNDRDSFQEDTKHTPEEVLDNEFQRIQLNLSEEILESVKKCPPEFFERLVIDLVVSMGYGGSRKEAGQVIGKSGDEGIDGVIKEDRLGLEVIYIQAKRWQGSVGRPEIQKFVGAMHGQKAGKGIFITTSSFTKDALDYADGIKDLKFVLIDGDNLAQHMIESDIGVSTVNSYSVKKIDADYFAEE